MMKSCFFAVALWLSVARGAYLPARLALSSSPRTMTLSMGVIKKQERNEDQGSGGLLSDKMKAAAADTGGSLFPSDDLSAPDISTYKKRMAKKSDAEQTTPKDNSASAAADKDD